MMWVMLCPSYDITSEAYSVHLPLNGDVILSPHQGVFWLLYGYFLKNIYFTEV